MTYALTWHPAAERDLVNLPHWRTAEKIARAVATFAADGSGQVEHTGRPGLYRLRAGGVVALFTIDVVAREIHVWRVLG